MLIMCLYIGAVYLPVNLAYTAGVIMLAEFASFHTVYLIIFHPQVELQAIKQYFIVEEFGYKFRTRG
jgi:uncharacterized membrane protein